MKVDGVIVCAVGKLFSVFCLLDNLFYLIVIFIESRFHIDGRRNFFPRGKNVR